MISFYKLGCHINSSSIFNENSLSFIRDPCWSSEFQFLNKEPVEIELSNNIIHNWPDFIFDGVVPLISERLKDVFDEHGIDYLFFKKVLLKQSHRGVKELYWLALPARINCLNESESVFDDGCAEEKVVINPTKIGRYDIFKISSIKNPDIYVSEFLYRVLSKLKNDDVIDGSIEFVKCSI